MRYYNDPFKQTYVVISQTDKNRATVIDKYS